jgi:endothelin-converting enzyme/putative endopeptidase
MPSGTEAGMDHGGFLSALGAYEAHLQADGYSGETYKEQLRKFYESYAYVWRVQYSDEKLAKFPDKDVHSHARLRANGVVMNTDLWYDLFGVDRNCRLFLPQERRAYIW